MYSIGTVIYGIDNSGRFTDLFREIGNYQEIDPAVIGWTELYHGDAAVAPAYLGPVLGEFAVFHDIWFEPQSGGMPVMKVKDEPDIRLAPTDTDIKEWERLREQSITKVRAQGWIDQDQSFDIIEALQNAKPRVMIVFSTS